LHGEMDVNAMFPFTLAEPFRTHPNLPTLQSIVAICCQTPFWDCGSKAERDVLDTICQFVRDGGRGGWLKVNDEDYATELRSGQWVHRKEVSTPSGNKTGDVHTENDDNLRWSNQHRTSRCVRGGTEGVSCDFAGDESRNRRCRCPGCVGPHLRFWELVSPKSQMRVSHTDADAQVVGPHL